MTKKYADKLESLYEKSVRDLEYFKKMRTLKFEEEIHIIMREMSSKGAEYQYGSGMGVPWTQINGKDTEDYIPVSSLEELKEKINYSSLTNKEADSLFENQRELIKIALLLESIRGDLDIYP